MPLILGFDFDDVNEEEIAEHELSVEQVVQVLENRHIIVPNRNDRTGTFL